MKIYGFRWTVSLIFIFGSISCAANLEMQKKRAKASRNFGEAYYRQGNYPAALGEFLKSETLYPGDPDCAGPGGIQVFDSEAQLLGRVFLPEFAANFTWGDDDLCTLYLAGHRALYRLRVKMPGRQLFFR